MTLWTLLQQDQHFWLALMNLGLGLVVGTTVATLILQKFHQNIPTHRATKCLYYAGFTLFFTLMMLGSYVTPALSVAVRIQKQQIALAQKAPTTY